MPTMIASEKEQGRYAHPCRCSMQGDDFKDFGNGTAVVTCPTKGRITTTKN
ncbi:hypothetical protein YC2023_081633 [Brassica napus]